MGESQCNATSPQAKIWDTPPNREVMEREDGRSLNACNGIKNIAPDVPHIQITFIKSLHFLDIRGEKYCNWLPFLSGLQVRFRLAVQENNDIAFLIKTKTWLQYLKLKISTRSPVHKAT